MVSSGNEGSSGIVLHCVDNDKVIKESLRENELLILLLVNLQYMSFLVYNIMKQESSQGALKFPLAVLKEDHCCLQF